MKTKEKILDINGFDFDAFKYENEFSAKNLLKSMDEYALEVVKAYDLWIKKEKLSFKNPNNEYLDVFLEHNLKEKS